MIKLTKAHFDGSYYISPSVISNGHWAIKRDVVSNQAQFATLELCEAFAGKCDQSREFTDEKMQRIMQLPTDPTAWVVTSLYSKEGRRDYVILVSANGDVAALDTRYTAMLGLGHTDVLWSTADGLSAMCSLEGSFVVMPTRIAFGEPIKAFAKAFVAANSNLYDSCKVAA